jgi:hypothetical protein
MPKICYVAKSFRKRALWLIGVANEIIEDYEAQGFDLTLRQLYYQLVSRDLIPNSEQSYKGLGSTINDARLAGLIDWERITDRTRNLAKNSHWSDPADIMAGAAQGYEIDRWTDQPCRPEVWVEKEALAGVVGAACVPLDVSYFCCRGYTSQSEMWGAAVRLLHYLRNGQRPVILHLGDHDPSGIDMSRDITDRLQLFLRHHLGGGQVFEFKRLALNMDQVEEYGPPPNPAKVTDARFAGYEAEYGDESWELDALEPSVLVELIQRNIRGVMDEALMAEAVERQERDRNTLLAVSERWAEVEEFLNETDGG